MTSVRMVRDNQRDLMEARKRIMASDSLFARMALRERILKWQARIELEVNGNEQVQLSMSPLGGRDSATRDSSTSVSIIKTNWQGQGTQGWMDCEAAQKWQDIIAETQVPSSATKCRLFYVSYMYML